MSPLVGAGGGLCGEDFASEEEHRFIKLTLFEAQTRDWHACQKTSRRSPGSKFNVKPKTRPRHLRVHAARNAAGENGARSALV